MVMRSWRRDAPGKAHEYLTNRQSLTQPAKFRADWLSLTEEEFQVEMVAGGASAHMIEQELEVFRVLKIEQEAKQAQIAERRLRFRDRPVDDGLLPYADSEKRMRERRRGGRANDYGEEE